jgi:hypothetical protein
MTDTGFVQYKASDISPPMKDYGQITIPEKSTPSTTYNAKSLQDTGFLEFKPRDMETQKKYDAYSPSWEGEESSNKAIASGLYDLDMAEKNRQDLRATKIQPKYENPKPVESAWNCIIQ